MSNDTMLDVDDYDIEDAVTGYLTAALWASSCVPGICDDDDCDGCCYYLPDAYDVTDVCADSLEHAETTFRKVLRRLALMGITGEDIEAALLAGPGVWDAFGHDLWLTRNNHGAGFWDGDWADTISGALTAVATDLGEAHLMYDRESQEFSVHG